MHTTAHKKLENNLQEFFFSLHADNSESSLGNKHLCPWAIFLAPLFFFSQPYILSMSLNSLCNWWPRIAILIPPTTGILRVPPCPLYEVLGLQSMVSCVLGKYTISWASAQAISQYSINHAFVALVLAQVSTYSWQVQDSRGPVCRLKKKLSGLEFCCSHTLRKTLKIPQLPDSAWAVGWAEN